MSNTTGMDPHAKSFGLELRFDHVQAGVKEFGLPAAVTEVVIRGVRYTQAELERKLEELNDPHKRLREAKAYIRQFSRDRRRLTREHREFLADLNASVAGILGRDNEELTRYGFKPARRRRALTVEEQTLAKAKAELTRKARGTMGKRQRAAIRATETPTVVIKDGKSRIEMAAAPVAIPVASPVASPAPVRVAIPVTAPSASPVLSDDHESQDREKRGAETEAARAHVEEGALGGRTPSRDGRPAGRAAGVDPAPDEGGAARHDGGRPE